MGNLPELPGIYPDYLAPIVILNSAGEREIILARWGMPSLVKEVPPDRTNIGTTNIQHAHYKDWEGYLGVEHRCLVPLTRFAEPCKLVDGSTGNARFALSKDEPLTFFAGLWTKWTGMRRKDEGPIKHNVFGFFTTEPNAIVRPIHPKAMPVILTTGEEQATWLTAPWSEARKFLQRPLADSELEIVSRLPYKELPVVGIPSGGDPLRIPAALREPTLSQQGSTVFPG